MRDVTLYSSPDCHLCHVARDKIARVRRLVPFRLTEVDIHTDPALVQRYGTTIPVVAVDGRDTLISKVTEFRLLKALTLG